MASSRRTPERIFTANDTSSPLKLEVRNGNLVATDVHEASTLPIFDDEDYELGDSSALLAPQQNYDPSTEQICKFGNITVRFPFQPYPGQLSIMETCIKGADLSQNCLVESPTGTGKTKAVICSLLAWQKQLENDHLLRNSSNNEEQDGHNASNNGEDLGGTCPSPTKKLKIDDDDTTKVGEKSTLDQKEDEDDDFHVPIIYYATRTQSQIEQMAKQLGQTAYADTPMAILASRKQVCLHDKASKAESVDQECNTLRTNFGKNEYEENKRQRLKITTPIVPLPTCQYYHGTVKISDFCKLKPGNFNLEDLISYGKDTCCCPYYEIGGIKKRAKIIFCTYQHLLDKRIRRASGINLPGNIVVFDEAHNIEDASRSIASSNRGLKLATIQDIVVGLGKILEEKTNIPPIKQGPLQDLKLGLQRLEHWLAHQLKHEAPGFYNGGKEGPTRRKFKRLLGEDFAEEMAKIQFCTDDIRNLWSSYFLLEDRHYTIKTSEDDWKFKVDNTIMRKVSQVLSCMGFLFKKDPVTDKFLNLEEYEKFLIKTRVEVPGSSSRSAFVTNSPSKQSKDCDTIELHLVCLNAAIVFKDMKAAKTVIVTSGTLSPTNSFSTELNMEFPIVLVAPHVMGPDRIFSCIVNNYKEVNNRLCFTWNSLEQNNAYEDHQQQLFEIISSICDDVPHGVLVFLTSYSFSKRLHDMWNSNGNLNSLKAKKSAFFEHDCKRPDNFQRMMKIYREVVEEPRGAILFAIHRGKISEGADFSDNQARAVVTVGLPLAPFSDDGIKAKMSYNTKKKSENPKYLSGQEWYQANAFRALNQSFGRCVRHVNDWGAIFIVDSRFSDDFRFRNSFSKWVQESLRVQGRRTSGSLDAILPDLNKFLKNLIIVEEDQN